MKPSEQLANVATRAYRCPFCAGKFFATLHPHAVMHSMPPCATFAALSATDFLAAVTESWTSDRSAS